MRRFAPVLTLVVLMSGCASAADWNPVAEAPEPLALPAGQDTLSADAYYRYGEGLLESSPTRAAQAFYWASRLDPSWAQPLFARRIALLLSEPRKFDQYLSGSDRLLRSPGVRALDSLYLRALTLNPFPQRRTEARAFRALMHQEMRRYMRRSNPGGEARILKSDLDYAIDDYLRTAPPATRGWVAYSEGRYGDAVTHYRRAADRHSDRPGIRADLARSLFMLARYDEAAEEMAAAVAAMNERDEEELVRVYESKALFEYSMGLMRETLESVDGARGHYAAALEQDLSFHPAHLRLADLALQEGDTLTAINEAALAVDIQPEDPVVRYQHGHLLRTAGRFEDAVRELRTAIELEPLYALSYLELARTFDDWGRIDEAVRQYGAYLQRAPESSPGAREAAARLEVIRSEARR